MNNATGDLSLELSDSVLRKFLAGCQGELDRPVYLYDMDVLGARIRRLKDLFGAEFDVSFAIKSNPNHSLLERVAALIDTFDASSFAEVGRARRAGMAPERISYSGPGKRRSELDAVIGTGVELVVESFDEIEEAAELARTKGLIQKVLIRINPDHVPRGFGASMSGKPSQFGFDEMVTAEAIAAIDAATHLELVGLHIYTGSNCLTVDALIENFQNMARLFLHFSQGGQRRLEKLIFGAGFGLPYHAGQEPLDILAVSQRTLDLATDLRGHPGLAQTRFVLELGRWLVGPCGALLTSVLSVKESRSQRIAVCDAGFNNHLAACGLMGSVFRKDWPIRHLTATSPTVESVKLTGPLCTSIDALAGPLDLPAIRRGDVLAVMLSGAYGLTASPTRFISHPDPVEILHENGQFRDATDHPVNLS